MLLRLEPTWQLTGSGSGELFSPIHLDASCCEGTFQPYSMLHSDLPLLGVRGVVEHEGRFLWGLRADWVSTYADHWELAPSGALSTADFRAQLIAELEEETGITQVAQVTPFAIIGDGRVRDLCCRMELTSPPNLRRGSEYADLCWLRDPPAGRQVPWQRELLAGNGG